MSAVGTALRHQWQRLLRLPLFAKILLANSAIVAGGATVGTYATTLHVRLSPHDTHYEMMVLFGGGGLALSVVFNAFVLRTALRPLARLERTARRVLAGDLDARASLGRIGDPDTDRLAVSFNAMLDSLQARTRQVEAYSLRLQELSDDLLVAQEEERRRIARELHDDMGQTLSSLLLGLRLFRDGIDRSQPDLPALRALAADLAEQARQTLDGVRQLALALRPRILEDLGLVAALRAYCQEWQARTRIQVVFDGELPAQVGLTGTAELAIYRVVQEALTNVAKHAAASHVTVTLRVQGEMVDVEVTDDGRGMIVALGRDGTPFARESGDDPGAPDDKAPPGRAPAEGARSSGGLAAGLGVFGMGERIHLVGGQLELRSEPGRGTTVHARVPLPDADIDVPVSPPSAQGGAHATGTVTLSARAP